MSKLTALTEEHERLGATMVDFAGWRMPLRYRGDLAEHNAVRHAGGLFDLSHMGEIDVTGAQAGEALDYALVTKVSALPVGKAKYTMIVRDDGGILDDLIVYRLGDEQFMVVANAANADLVLSELRSRAGGFETQVHDSCDDWALVALQGPVATEVLRGLTDADLPGLKYYTILEATVAGLPARLARTGYTGEDGYEIFCAPGDAVAIWQAVLDAGQAHGVIPCGLASRDSLRLEAGMPLYGNELSTEVTPYEANLGRVVNLDREDFVGRAALAERAQSGPARTLVGLKVSGRRAARHDYPVEDGDGTEIGTVTSGLPSPTLGYPIAMAYVRPEFSEPGTSVQVSLRGKGTPSEVVALPFYKRAR